MRKNEKGFTLVELLAVIVILGLLMAIAIPSVTKYITQSRKKTLISSVDSYVTAVNDNEFGALSKEDTMYYVPVSNDEANSCVSLEKGGTDPFGNWKEAYVVVNYDADNYSYDYYFTFYDDAGYGMELTKIEDISASGNIITNPSPVNADNITTQTNDRASNVKVLTTGSCDVSTAVNSNVDVNNAGGVNETTNEKTLIFTYGSEQFQYVEGMTWREWVNSKYNTAGYDYTLDDYIAEKGHAPGGIYTEEQLKSMNIVSMEMYKLYIASDNRLSMTGILYYDASGTMVMFEQYTNGTNAGDWYILEDGVTGYNNAEYADDIIESKTYTIKYD